MTIVWCSYYNSDWASYSPYYRDFLAQFFLAQIDAFEWVALH